MLARLSTFVFTVLTLVIAINAESFGGILGLIISWFAAIVGPISIPMILGLLPAFRHCDSKAAIVSILGGLTSFIVVKYMIESIQVVQIASPFVVSFILFVLIGWLSRNKVVSEDVNILLDKLELDEILPLAKEQG